MDTPQEPSQPTRKTAFPKRKWIRSGIEVDAPSRSHRSTSESPRRQALARLAESNRESKLESKFPETGQISQAAIETSALPEDEIKRLSASQTTNTGFWKPLSQETPSKKTDTHKPAHRVQVEPDAPEPAKKPEKPAEEIVKVTAFTPFEEVATNPRGNEIIAEDKVAQKPSVAENPFTDSEPFDTNENEIDQAEIETNEVPVRTRQQKASVVFAKLSEEAAEENTDTEEKEKEEEEPPAKPSRKSKEKASAKRTGKTVKPAKPKRKSGRKQKLVAFSVLTVVLLAVIGLAFWAVSQFSPISLFAEKDYPGPGGKNVEVIIPEGASGTAIANILVKADVIKTAGVFIEAWNNNPQSESIRPGTYRLKTEIPARQALATLLNPNNRISTGVEIRTGMPIWKVKEQLMEHGGYSSEEVDKALKDTASLGIPASANGYAEGWLAPGNYNVTKGTDLKTILKQMVQKTKDTLKELNVPEDQQEQILIKASIAEREVASTKYYGKVITVINNRLKDGNETAGFLGMDTTIMYGLHKDSGELTLAELQKDTPYNTRLHKGLPPSPICAVGVDALKAAMHPEAGDWLYFVTINYDTGETLFSNNSQQFEKDKQLYIQYCKDNPDKCK